MENLDKIKKVLELLTPSDKIKLATVRILKEEGKDGGYVCKSRPRRRSTLKKSKLKQFREEALIITQRRKSKRPQVGSKRNSRELNISTLISQNDEKDKPEKRLRVKETSPVVFPPSLIGEKRNDDVLTDNECHSLKIPSLIDFNLSNTSNRGNSKFFFEDRLSESSFSNKMSHCKIQTSLHDNLTDNEMNEAFENLEKFNPSRKNSITDYFNLKRLSAASLFLHNHFHKNKDLQENLKASRDVPSNGDRKTSIRMQVSNINNSEQLKLIRSLSQISNKANHDYELPKCNVASNSLKADTKFESTKHDSTLKVPQISNFNDELVPDFERTRGMGFFSKDNDLSWINGNRNYSKRNSLISNISAIF